MCTHAKLIFPVAVLISLPGVSAESGRPIRRIERGGNQYHLLVDGQPFLMLGAQAHNSSATSAQDLEPFWKSLVGIHGNTAKVNFRELEGPPRDAEILTLEEGTFDGERWVSTRGLNGDELHVDLPEQSKILRVRLLQ